jgi:hypothetical protein
VATSETRSRSTKLTLSAASEHDGPTTTGRRKDYLSINVTARKADHLQISPSKAKNSLMTLLAQTGCRPQLPCLSWVNSGPHVPKSDFRSPPKADSTRPSHYVRFVPNPEVGGRHSITSSARITKGSGTVTPIALAVLRFTARLNFVGSCTGRSPGRSPRKTRSTYSAVLRKLSSQSTL